MPERSPWFNARNEPPVNGADHAFYEHRCSKTRGQMTPVILTASLIKRLGSMCAQCQWRGLLRKEASDA